MKSAGNMLNQLHGMVGTNDLGEWETRFVLSLWDQTSEGKDTRPLTGKQIDKLLDVYERHFSD